MCGLLSNKLQESASSGRQIERRRAEDVAAEMEGVTFEPRITKLAQQLGGSGDASKPWSTRLHKLKTSKAADRVAMLRQEMQQEETRECTFRPIINRRSKRLMAERAVMLKVQRTATRHLLAKKVCRFLGWHVANVGAKSK
jgi:hypothetical protein